MEIKLIYLDEDGKNIGHDFVDYSNFSEAQIAEGERIKASIETMAGTKKLKTVDLEESFYTVLKYSKNNGKPTEYKITLARKSS